MPKRTIPQATHHGPLGITTNLQQPTTCENQNGHNTDQHPTGNKTPQRQHHVNQPHTTTTKGRQQKAGNTNQPTHDLNHQFPTTRNERQQQPTTRTTTTHRPQHQQHSSLTHNNLVSVQQQTKATDTRNTQHSSCTTANHINNCQPYEPETTNQA